MKAILVLFSLTLLLSFASASLTSTIQLNGASSVDVNDSSILDGMSQGTWNIWVNQNSYVDGAGLVSKYHAISGGRSFFLRTVLTRSISFGLSGDGSTTSIQTSTSDSQCGIRNNNEWTMITIAYDAGKITYFRNGVKCSTDTSTVSKIFNSNQKMRIGIIESKGFKGKIDQYTMYKSNLTKNQVLRLYDESIHGRNLGQSITVLLYHQVVTNANAPDKVTITNFQQQMKFLKDSGYTSITIDDYNNWKKGAFTMPKKPVIIFFDDGWQSVYDNAYPIMKSLGLKGNVAIITNYANHIEGGPSYMGWTTLKELQNNGWAFSAHGIKHISMLSLSQSAFRNQLSASKSEIESKLSTKITSFVFPFHAAYTTYTSICGQYYDLCWTRGEKASLPNISLKSE